MAQRRHGDKDWPGMDIKDLRFFIAVYDEKNFSRASESLGTVQSNVSTRIRDLEDFLGVELFDRQYRAVIPTPTAVALYGHAKELLEMLERIEQAIRVSAVA
jgi:LysR family transcriptional regulator, cyn operon transcriptional activator